MWDNANLETDGLEETSLRHRKEVSWERYENIPRNHLNINSPLDVPYEMFHATMIKFIPVSRFRMIWNVQHSREISICFCYQFFEINQFMVPEISRKYGIENKEIILEEYAKCERNMHNINVWAVKIARTEKSSK